MEPKTSRPDLINFIKDKRHIEHIVDKYKDKYPEVYGINRSGSTLLYNIVNTIFDGNVGVKRGAFFETDQKIIGVYRDFRDSAISQWRVNSWNQVGTFACEKDAVVASWDQVHTFAHEIRRQVREDLRRLRERYDDTQLLLVRYELYNEDFDYLCDQLEIFLDIVISQELRGFINQTWNKQRVRKEYTEPLKDFWYSNEETYFHGGHIYKGSHGTWKELLRPEDHHIINEFMKEELEEWEYQL